MKELKKVLAINKFHEKFPPLTFDKVLNTS